MSRSYRMDLGIEGYLVAKLPDIQEAIDAEWDFSEFLVVGKHTEGAPTEAECSGEGSLCGGESEAAFAERLAKAIFRANGRPCKVELAIVFLEDPPCEYFTFGEKDFDRLDPMKGK